MAARPLPSAAERRAGCADAAAAITARTSSTCSSSGEAPATPSDIPVPRRSNTIRRANAASRRQEPGHPRHLPRDLDVRQERGNEDDVERALAHHLVGDPQLTAAGVPRDDLHPRRAYARPHGDRHRSRALPAAGSSD